MSVDIGESLVGSYLRQVRGCDFVIYNTHLPSQGEIDVIGLKQGVQREVWLCEVATHVDGINYGSYDITARKVRQKIERASEFAHQMFTADKCYFELWSPRVPKGKLSVMLDAMAESFAGDGIDVHIVANDLYHERVQELIECARTHSGATSDPAYRLLQILTRVTGELKF
ncbi:MAG TPA: hypothetical protein VGD71_12470 [Kribbella sp.]